MKILVLDDERWRHDAYDKALVGHEIHHAYTVRQFRAKLKQVQRWDLISLDHDLGEPESKVGNGVDAAKLVVKCETKPVLVVVHSWNPAAAPRMVDTLVLGEQNVIRHVFGTQLLESVLPGFGFGFVPIRDSRASR